MKNLPVHVEDASIEDMFNFADKDHDGKLSYSEFLVMVSPPTPQALARPHVSELGMAPQQLSPNCQPPQEHT